MRYTVDYLEFPETDVPAESPLLVEMHLPDKTYRLIRDPAGKSLVGGEPTGSIGREICQLMGDPGLLERLQPLCDALRALEEEMDVLDPSTRGAHPESPDEEAQMRMEMRFGFLAAHALAAVELITREG